MSQEVLLSIDNHIATLTLNRPHKGNALTSTMNKLLLSYLHQLERDIGARVIVLTGTGIQVFETWFRYPKPVIARINGPCLGGGVGLVFTEDIRVAHQDVYFALTEAKRGLIPAIISQYIVPELGSQKSKEYMLTGTRVSAQETMSFLTIVSTTIEQLDAQVKTYGVMLLESAPGAMANVKRLVETISSGVESQRDARIQKKMKVAYIIMMQSEEAAYGINSYMTKKKPDWSDFAKIKNNAKL